MINKTKRLDPEDKKLDFAILIRESLLKYLKDNKRIYQEVADELGISLSSFKRLMDHCDFSLRQVVQIAAYMKLGLIDLLQHSTKPQRKFHEFTAAQEEFFVKNPRAFYCLIHIMKGSSILELCQELSLNRQEVQALLRQLDKTNMIQILPRGRFKVVSMGPFRWRKGGALEQRFYKKFCQSIYEKMPEAFDCHPEENSFNPPGILSPVYRPFEFYLQTSSYIEFKNELNELILKYHNRALVESDQIYAKDLIPASGAISLQSFDAWRKVLLKDGTP